VEDLPFLAKILNAPSINTLLILSSRNKENDASTADRRLVGGAWANLQVGFIAAGPARDAQLPLA